MNTFFIGSEHFASGLSPRAGIRPGAAVLFPLSRRLCAAASGTAQEPPSASPLPSS